MNPTNNLTAAKIRRMFLVTALVISPILAFQSSYAGGSVATATLTSGGMTSINILGNQSFTLTLSVTTNFVSSGYTVFYQTTNGQQFFQAVSRTNISPIHPNTGGPVFDDPTTGNAQAFGGDAGRLYWGGNPPTAGGGSSNRFDLGYTGDQFNNQDPGTFGLQTITFNTLNAPIGTYTIFLDNRSIMVDRPVFGDVPMGGMMGPQFTVNVIPEPATIGLAVMGGGMLLVAVWRKRRAQA
jgi:hypothetical protein